MKALAKFSCGLLPAEYQGRTSSVRRRKAVRVASGIQCQPILREGRSYVRDRLAGGQRRERQRARLTEEGPLAILEETSQQGRLAAGVDVSRRLPVMLDHGPDEAVEAIVAQGDPGTRRSTRP
jgi:hypothetical protein